MPRGFVEYEIDGVIYSIATIQVPPIEALKEDKEQREALIKRAALRQRDKDEPKPKPKSTSKGAATQGFVSTLLEKKGE